MRRPVLALVAALVLVLAGCSTIPNSGPVQPGTTEAPNGTKLVYVPNPPATGASQDEIVSGFLTAAGGGGTFAVAKQYLTDAFAKKWDPTTRVLVQETQATLSGSGDVRAEIPVSARVNAHGVYTPASGGETLPFHLVQQRGQWRIDSAPNGIVLTQSVFQQTYQPRLLQFFDATWSRLVPDRRWFPTTRTQGGSGIDPGSIVAALIDGPAGPLTGGVAANALRGTKLAGSPSTGDVTTVTLSTDGTNPDSTTITRMQQQLVASLGAPTRLVVNDLVVPQAKPIADQLTPQAYVLVGNRFGTLSSTGVFTEDPTLGSRIAATKPVEITVSPRQKLAAVQTSTGAVELVTTAGAKPVDSRSGLLPPTVDQSGWVYTVTGSGGLQAANGKTTTPVGGDLGSGAITAIQVSPDGTRLLVLLSGQTGLSAFVAGIERDSTGRPTGLTTGSASRSTIDVGSAGASGSGAATWIDDDDVAVLLNGTDSDQIITQQLGGISGALGPFANVTTIVGTTTADDLRIRVQSGGSGTVYVWTKPNWQQQSDAALNVSVLAVQR